MATVDLPAMDEVTLFAVDPALVVSVDLIPLSQRPATMQKDCCRVTSLVTSYAVLGDKAAVLALLAGTSVVRLTESGDERLTENDDVRVTE